MTIPLTLSISYGNIISWRILGDHGCRNDSSIWKGCIRNTLLLLILILITLLL